MRDDSAAYALAVESEGIEEGVAEYHILYGEDSREHLLHEEGHENDRMRPWQTD